MRSRIKEIRIESGLTQKVFAEKLKLSRNFISLIENGDRIPSDRTIRDICNLFHVEDNWLRYGKGPMKKPIDNELSAYASEIINGNDEFIKNFIKVYMELDSDGKATIQSFFNKMTEKTSNT